MRKKFRVVRLILTEIVIMALGVLCCIMPMPWRLVVPIIIGTRSILIKAHLQLKERKLAESTADLPQVEIREKSNAKKNSKNKKTVEKKVGKKGTNKADNKKAA